MRVHFGAATVGVLAAAFMAATAMAQDDANKGLSAAQEKRALEIEAASAPPAGMMARGTVGQALPGLASTIAGQLGKIVRPMVVPLETGMPVEGTRGAGAPASSRAVVMRYDYATGVTTRTTVDLASGKAVHVRQDANYPTPLAQEEYDQALALARRQTPEFDAIIKGAPQEELRIHTQMPLYDNPSHPRYGHRLVVLWIEAPTPSSRITVDLSTNEVVSDHH